MDRPVGLTGPELTCWYPSSGNHLIPTTIESGPQRGSTRISLNPAVAHPTATVRACEVETGLGTDQHVQAHEQDKRILSPLIVNNRFVNDERPAFWQRGMRL